MDFRGKTILLVEDDIPSVKYFEAILLPTGVRLIHADNGVDAFVRCIKEEKIDLVLLDIKLPRINGMDALKLIRRYRADTPVIVQTAYAWDSDRQKCYSLGCVRYLTKPIIPAVLLETLHGFFFPGKTPISSLHATLQSKS